MASEKIFFSYSRDDSSFALKLAKDLRNNGAEIWLDQLDIKPGSHWDASIEIALNDATCVIAILSPSSIASNNVMDEISFALEDGKRVIPVLLHECKPPFRLRRLQHIDFTSEYESGFNQLAQSFNLLVTKEILLKNAVYKKDYKPSEFRLSVNAVDQFKYNLFSIDRLDFEKDFILEFTVQSYRPGGSTRYGIAWNFENEKDFLLFTIHTIGSAAYSIGAGNSSTYKSWKRFQEGDISLNGKNVPDVFQIKKMGGKLIFVINNTEVWRTSTYKLSSNHFAFWVADTSDAALLRSALTQ
jgi:hypothetical protein